MKREAQKKIKETLDEQSIRNAQGELNRARSLTVGTAFGGILEVNMRANDGSMLWCTLQPVEAVELIHQLAAASGCHLQLIPRRDFAAWRDWRLTEEELAHYRGNQHLPGVGHPPHVNDMAPHALLGAAPNFNQSVSEEGKIREQVMAAKAPKQRRKSKRTAASA